MSTEYGTASFTNIPQELIDILNVSCSHRMQIKVNNLIKQYTSFQSFIIWIPDESNEGIIQVVGEDVLSEELQFSIGSQEILQESLDDKGTWSINEELFRVLNVHLATTPKYFHKIPIFRHGDDDSPKIVLLCCLLDCPAQTAHDDTLTNLFRVIAGPLITALGLRRERRRKEQSQELLSIAKDLFMHLGDLVDLMQEIIVKARQLTNAERCSLFLVSENEKELVAKILDGMPRDQAEEFKIPMEGSIAGHVASTGKTLNIRDTYSHPLFYRKFDEMTGFRTRNILCFPIRDSKERIVGVAQLCNKLNGPFFTTLDEEAAAALATYCGISLMHSLVYKKIQRHQARIRLSNELLMYHMALAEDSVAEVTQCRKDHDVACMLDSRWPCREVLADEAPCLTLAMFEELGFLESCRMNRTTVARFILMVKKGYREQPYHNWMHAFSAAHFTYFILKSLDLVGKSYVTELEGVALLTSALCHDLDHRGTTNSFQTKTKNTLACLYSSEGSVMERHHFAQALCILNTDGCNIFEELDTASYRRILDLVRDLILATDLATHLSLISNTRKVAESFDSSNLSHRQHLLSLLMTAADLSDQVKGWRYTRNIANLIYEEFFAQGDLEKAMGTKPAVMMDRDAADIPALQVQFLIEICLPCFSVLASFFKELDSCECEVKDTLRRWQQACKWFALPKNAHKTALQLLNDSDLEAFVYRESD